MLPLLTLAQTRPVNRILSLSKNEHFQQLTHCTPLVHTGSGILLQQPSSEGAYNLRFASLKFIGFNDAIILITLRFICLRIVLIGQGHTCRYNAEPFLRKSARQGASFPPHPHLNFSGGPIRLGSFARIPEAPYTLLLSPCMHNLVHGRKIRRKSCTMYTGRMSFHAPKHRKASPLSLSTPYIPHVQSSQECEG